uniref:Uncharacterized protein n=1 Tax=Panagrolaimus sp. ES5 TaxID=591445 RepID=A0AC34GFT6_9BILA
MPSFAFDNHAEHP